MRVRARARMHVCVCVRACASLFSRTNINHRIGYGLYMCIGPTINGLRARQNGSPVDPVFSRNNTSRV